MVNPIKKINEQFFADRSVKNQETECLEWTLHLNQGGYGTMKHKQKFYMAHRAMWEFTNGPIPHGMVICHKCDNRKCINPDHLFIGTTQDNVDDKMSKGRFVKCPGEQCGTAKLTETQIAAIRMDTRAQHRIAKDYGISQSNVCIIKQGDTWKHLPVFEDKRMSVKEFAAEFGVPYERFRHHLVRRGKGFRKSLGLFGVTI
jgi:hypothetical protein